MTKSSTAARADGLERELAEQTTGAGPCRGVSLVGPGGLLSGVAKDVLETARERS
ncbi:MAG: hypothetical protein ACXV3F_11280 [Frankiaceae bacterium]